MKVNEVIANSPTTLCLLLLSSLYANRWMVTCTVHLVSAVVRTLETQKKYILCRLVADIFKQLEDMSRINEATEWASMIGHQRWLA